MWEFVASVILFSLPAIISGLVGIFSLFLYFRTKKTGFVPIGVGFLLQACLGWVSLAFFIVLSRTYGRGIVDFLNLLSLVSVILSVIPPILVLTGLILLRNEFKSKPMP